MQQAYSIRTAIAADANDIAALSITTFRESFGTHNSEEDLELFFSRNFDEHRIEDELNHPYTIFYLVEINTNVVGYMKISATEANSHFPDEHTVEIERIYLLKQFQGYGIGESLLIIAENYAIERKCSTLWLGVWEKNPRAIAFYQRHGFATFDQHIFKLGNDEQNDLLMRKKII